MEEASDLVSKNPSNNLKLYDEIVNKNLLIRRINIAANHVINEKDVVKKDDYEQLDLFTDYEEQAKKKETEEKAKKS